MKRAAERCDTAIGLFIAPKPFSPRIERLSVEPGTSVAGMIAAAINAGVLPNDADELDLLRVYVDGEPLPFASPEERLESLDVVPPAGAEVNLSVEPQGGSNTDARNALSVLVQIAAYVVAGPAGPLAVAAATIAGNLAVNALFPVVTPSSLGAGRGGATLQDAGNPLRRRGMMPLQLGTSREPFDLAAKPYTRLVGQDVWLDVIFGVHYGPCSVSDIKIGETLLSDYPSSEYRIEQFLTPGPRTSAIYRSRVDQENLSDELDVRTPAWEVHTAQAGAEKVELDFTWPSGLGFTKENGTLMHHAVRVEVQWAPVGTETWTAVPIPGAGSGHFGDALPAGVFEVFDRTNDAIRRTVEFTVPNPAVQIKLRAKAYHLDGNDVTRSRETTVWTALRSIELKPPVTDEYLSIIVLSVKASDDLNGTLPVVTGVITPHAPVWTGSEWLDDIGDWEPTSNPVALARMLLVGPTAARPLSADEIDASAETHHELCEARGWSGGYRLADDVTQEDALRILGAIGRFSAYDNGEALCLVPDWEKPLARQVFTGRNVQNYRYTRSFPEPVHALVVEFRNVDVDADWDEVIVYNDGYDADTADLYESQRIEYACTADRAYREGRVWLAKRQLQVETHEWTAGADSLASTYGDRVKVRHSSALFGAGEGRVQFRKLSGGLVSGVRLDEAVTMEAGKTYAVDVRRADMVIPGIPVQTVPGKTRDLTFASPLPVDEAPEANDLLAFGETNLVTEDLEIVDIEFQPDDTAVIRAVRYLAEEIEAAETGPIPPLTSSVRPKPKAPTPRILGADGSPSGVTVSFDIPPVGAGATVKGFAVRWRRTPDEGQTTPWVPLPDLPAQARSVRTPAINGAVYDPSDPDSEHRVDVEIRCVLADGQVSEPPAVAEGVLVLRDVPTPTGLTVSATLLEYEDDLPVKTRRTAKPQLAVSVDPVTAGLISELLVEYRLATATPGPWIPLQPLRAANPTGRYTVIGGGSTYDVRVAWRTSDGWTSAVWADVFGVIVNGDEVSDDTDALKGRDGDEVLDALDSAVENATAATSDSVLTPGEKVILNPQIQGIRNARTALVARATSLGVGTALSAYTTAMDALDAYLATLTSPVAWDNLAGNTTVDGPTFISNVRDAVQRESELNAANDAEAAKQAVWTSVGSRPVELTDGRVAAGLDAAGDLARNIATARANASNLLRRTAGGLFTGELDADVTGSHTAAAIIGQGALATKAAVSAAEILAGAVLPSHTQLGDTSNAYPDPEFADASLYTGDAPTFQPTASDGGPSKNQLVIAANAAEKNTYGPAMAVQASKSYLASCWMETTGTGSNGAEYYVVWYSDNAATVEISTSSRLGISTSTTPARFSQPVTAPSTAKRAKFKFRKPAPTSGAGRAAVYSAPGFRRLTDSELAAQNGFRLGFHLVREDGTTSLTDALAVTSLGVASAVTGQGALATKSQAAAGDIAPGAIVGAEVSGAAEFILGSGANTIGLSGSDPDFALWAGASSPGSAITRLWRNGVLDTSAFRAVVNGVEYWNSVTGPTAAGAEAFLQYATDAVPYTSTRSAGVALSASTASPAGTLSAQLGASSTVSLAASVDLSLTERTTDDWPSSLTLTLYERYRATETDSWGAWTSRGTTTLSKVSAGTPTSSQYRVDTRIRNVPIPGSPGEFDEVTYWYVSAPAALDVAVSATTKAEGLYEYAVTSSATFMAPATVTLTDTDGSPSYVRADVSSSGSVSFALPDGYKSRLRVDSTGNTTVSVTAAALLVVTNSGLQRTVRNFSASADLTTSGAGGLDTGAKAANTWYHLWAISNGTLDRLLFSTSATLPLMPSGYSHKTRLGAVRTDASGNIIPFKQRGAKTRITNAANMPTIASGSAGNIATPWATVSITDYAPSTALEIAVRARAGGGVVIVNPNSNYGAWNVANGPYFMIDSDNAIHVVEIMLESSNLYWASNTANASLRCAGWTDEI